jgi:T4 RnlA family RNA ligase
VFPSKLSDLDHLRNEPMVKFKTEMVNNAELTIVCYMIASPSLWDIPLSAECRGITYHNNHCICAPFEKFWNMNERESTLASNLPSGPYTIMDKIDGSMVTPVLIKNKILFKTKKSFTSDVAILANQTATPELLDKIRPILLAGYTPIFEFTHPDCRIVIDYGEKPAFTLLACRSIVTGAYISMNNLALMCNETKTSLVKFSHSDTAEQSFEQFRLQLEQETGREGCVIIVSDGSRVKVKTLEYLRLHRIRTGLRVRDVARMVIDETIDDAKSMIVESGEDLGPITTIESQVVAELAGMVRSTTELYSEFTLLPDRKSVALAYRDHKYFGLAMQLYIGRDPDYVRAWKNWYLPEYSLRQVYGFGVIETDA